MSDDRPTPPMGPGAFCWNELLTKDPETCKKFYGGLFGWEPSDMDMGPAGTYTLWMRGEQMLGGMMSMPPNVPAEAPPHWLSYIEVADVDASHAKAVELGATSCCEPRDIPNIGRFAVLQDPVGAVFAIYKSTSA